MSTMRIVRLSSHPAIRLAAAELKRCLAEATGCEVQVQSRKRYRPTDHTLWLGEAGDLPNAGLATGAGHDAFAIDVDAEGGFVAGSNPRSVLIGAYRYLQELGCRWIRPGRDGEIIPALDAPLSTVNLSERAAYDHRGVCIEGAVSYENVRDMVDWLPKLGFNGYFIQFREAYNFFQRWYEHTGNPRLPGRPFSTARAADMTRRLRAEIVKRGMDLHMVGHGWTCEPFGIPGPGWFQHQGPIPDEARSHLAQIDGVRELWGGIALNTNLCYGNPETRRIIVRAIVDYARTNSDANILHFWLADGTNNHCECPLCVDHRPADLYVRMLNELDAALTAAGLDTRIVFLVYVDLLWPPQVEKIARPERFILMFAPITRSYTTAFATGTSSADTSGGGSELPPYLRNHLEFPREPGLNLAFLNSWQQGFDGDGFDFDYHLMWDHLKDPGQMASARILHEDVQRLRDIGLNGLMSCQVQRVHFPSALTMTVMGRTLWNRDLPFDALADEHLRDTFGDQFPRVRDFLGRMSELFTPAVIRGEGSDADRHAAADRLDGVPGEVAALHRLVAAGLRHQAPAVARSWAYLAHFLDYCMLLSEALRARYRETPGAVDKAWALFTWARQHERDLQPVMDLFELQTTLGPVLGLSHAELEARR